MRASRLVAVCTCVESVSSQNRNSTKKVYAKLYQGRKDEVPGVWKSKNESCEAAAKDVYEGGREVYVLKLNGVGGSCTHGVTLGDEQEWDGSEENRNAAQERSRALHGELVVHLEGEERLE